MPVFLKMHKRLKKFFATWHNNLNSSLKFYYAQLAQSTDRRVRRKEVRRRLHQHHHYFSDPVLAAGPGRLRELVVEQGIPKRERKRMFNGEAEKMYNAQHSIFNVQGRVVLL